MLLEREECRGVVTGGCCPVDIQTSRRDVHRVYSSAVKELLKAVRAFDESALLSIQVQYCSCSCVIFGDHPPGYCSYFCLMVITLPAACSIQYSMR